MLDNFGIEVAFEFFDIFGGRQLFSSDHFAHARKMISVFVYFLVFPKASAEIMAS
jgi:hypothetical protein